MEDKKGLIKISFLIPSSEIGGTERMLLLMIENLPADIFSPPVVFTIKGYGRFIDELRARGIRVYTFNLKSRPLDFIKLLYYIKRESPDILHSFLFYGNLIGRVIGKILKIPVVISSQRSTDLWRKRYHWIIDRLTAKWADIIISNSFKGKDVLIDKGGISSSKVIVIPNGIKISEPDRKITKEELGISPSEYIVGNVGNLREAKGHIYIISAATIILKDFPNTRFIIVGEGELKRFLIKEAERLGVLDRFIFTGFLNSPSSIISLFDVFVFPSLWEGCPVGLLEAMMLGKSCVAFPVGDIPYIIEDGVSGILVEYKSSEKLASAVVSLLKDKKLREDIGIAANKRVLEYFSLEVMMERYISTYLGLMQNLRYICKRYR
ncbi:MAG: glycosyltransferase [Candidatus Omnitrophica bacterium]|nr:glycosyltransferase [Candidatus Omnitrophota bacterium]MCM8777302.1 glycosyltransferase [Candidatus Omnitrophota bacterium]